MSYHRLNTLSLGLGALVFSACSGFELSLPIISSTFVNSIVTSNNSLEPDSSNLNLSSFNDLTCINPFQFGFSV